MLKMKEITEVLQQFENKLSKKPTTLRSKKRDEKKIRASGFGKCHQHAYCIHTHTHPSGCRLVCFITTLVLRHACQMRIHKLDKSHIVQYVMLCNVQNSKEIAIRPSVCDRNYIYCYNWYDKWMTFTEYNRSLTSATKWFQCGHKCVFSSVINTVVQALFANYRYWFRQNRLALFTKGSTDPMCGDHLSNFLFTENIGITEDPLSELEAVLNNP